MLSMKQTASIISTYTADVSGVCSALYELGGMTIIHDPSGCNSTYTTHDEPRWYDMDGMVYISGLTEMEAIMGDDDKLIHDIVYAANELSPRFIAIVGTPIPMMIGTDFMAIASIIEQKTGIPTFGFDTNGMHSYISGVSRAFEELVGRMVDKNVQKTREQTVNIIGATPLDFSIYGCVESMKKLLTDHGFSVISTWAMGCTLDDIRKAGSATVNLVVSYSGLAAAKELERMFGTPYVVGAPFGNVFTNQLMQDLEQAANTKKNKRTCIKREVSEPCELTIIGESVTSGSLAAAIYAETGKSAQLLCPLETQPELLVNGDFAAQDEDDLIPHLEKAKVLIADPLYRPICPKSCAFIPLPHEAFSGRIFHKQKPNLITDFNGLLEKIKEIL